MRGIRSKLLIIAATAAAGLFAAVPASASVLTYTFNVDSCTGGCGLTDYGTVTLTDIAGGVSVDIAFANSGVGMIDTGALGGESFDFSLDKAPSSIAWPTGFTADSANGVSTPPPIDSNHFGLFDFAMGCSGGACGSGGSSPDYGPISFDVWGVNVNDFVASDTCAKVKGKPALPCSSTDIFFAADIYNYNGGSPLTGPIGATLGGGGNPGGGPVPEPMTLALFGAALAGFGALRRRKA